ncbi:hypothetical protein [Rhizobium sp.]|uniref:hypothetical protein n=1 Tax=Rhizobium sp. TaxID=391 RepID=UPI0034C63F33
MLHERLIYRRIMFDRQAIGVRRRVDNARSNGQPDYFDPLAIHAPTVKRPDLRNHVEVDRVDFDSPFFFPGKHNGVRKVQRNSDRAAVGFTIYNNRRIYHESTNELRVSVELQANPEVVDIRSQFPKALFNDGTGKRRYHIFDYYVLLTSGERCAIAVRSEKYRAAYEEMFDWMALEYQAEFDRAIFWSNSQATRHMFANARDKLWARDEHDSREVEIVRDRMRRLPNEIWFWELYERGVHNWARHAAIWYLIGQGELEPQSQLERISYISRLTIVR